MCMNIARVPPLFGGINKMNFICLLTKPWQMGVGYHLDLNEPELQLSWVESASNFLLTVDH